MKSIGLCIAAICLFLVWSSSARAEDDDATAVRKLDELAQAGLTAFDQAMSSQSYEQARSALVVLEKELADQPAITPRVSRRLNELNEGIHFRRAQSWWHEAGLNRPRSGTEPPKLLCRVIESALDYLNFWGQLSEGARKDMPRFEDFSGVASPGRAASMSARISNVATEYLKVPGLLILVFNEVEAASLGPEALDQWYDTLGDVGDKTAVLDFKNLVPPELQSELGFVTPKSVPLCEALEELESRDKSWVDQLVSQQLLGQLKQKVHEKRRAALHSRFLRVCKPENH